MRNRRGRPLDSAGLPDLFRVPTSAFRVILRSMRHVYLHVPFCRRRCSYCDFSIAVRKRIPAREYVTAVLGELDLVRTAEPGAGGLENLYLRGGTPSLLPPQALGNPLRSIRNPQIANRHDGEG